MSQYDDDAERFGERDDDDGRRFEEPVSLGYGFVLALSERGAQIEIDGAAKWFPLAQIVGDTKEWQPGMTVELVITAWLARERGIE